VRTPFVKAFTYYRDKTPVELASLCVKGIIVKINLKNFKPDGIIMGNVIPYLKGPNIAREVVYQLGLDPQINAYTINTACISGLRAITTSVESINTKQADFLIAGGVDSISFMSVPYRTEFIQSLYKASKEKNPLEKAFIMISSIRPKYLIPSIPEFRELSTNLRMGDYGEILADIFHLNRHELDEFSLKSHKKGYEAFMKGTFKEDILNIQIGSEKISVDTTLRPDTSLEKLSKLKPVFKKNGKLTAGNSSPVTDGAATILICSESGLKKFNLKPLAKIKNYRFSATDNDEKLLLAPIYAITTLLEKDKLTLNDIDIFEIHEAFASQILATIKCLNNKKLCKKILNIEPPDGRVEDEKVNVFGGSIALGHPFSATGIRLVMNAVRTLKEKNGRYALVSSCAAGGLGCALLIENL